MISYFYKTNNEVNSNYPIFFKFQNHKLIIIEVSECKDIGYNYHLYKKSDITTCLRTMDI